MKLSNRKWLNVFYEEDYLNFIPNIKLIRTYIEFFLQQFLWSWIYILSLWCCDGNFHCSNKSSIFISCPRGWRHLSEYYLAIVGWLSSGSPAGDRQMFRGDPIRRPPKQCATINHQTICHPPEQSGCLDDHEPKHTQPFSSLVFSWSECKWAYVFTAGLIILRVMMRAAKSIWFFINRLFLLWNFLQKLFSKYL